VVRVRTNQDKASEDKRRAENCGRLKKLRRDLPGRRVRD
jgi:hypothetical protein